jgi:hypothetical protein
VRAASSDPPQDALRGLLAERDCRAVLTRYGIALDWQDRAALATVFWPEAQVDYGFFKGGATPFVDVLLHIATLSLRRFHMTSNEHVLVEGHTAQAQSCIVTQTVSLNAEGEQRSNVFLGRFLDDFECRDGEWRIQRRVYLQHGAYESAYQESATLTQMIVADGLSTQHALWRRS